MDKENLNEEMVTNEETVSEEVVTNEEVVTKQVNVRKVKVGPLIGIIVAVVVLILAAAVLFTYNRFINNPVKIFERAINSMYDEFHNSLKDIEKTEDDYFNFEEEAINVEADLKLDGSFMNFYQLKDNVLKVNCGVDYKNDLISMGAKILENDKDLIDGNLYLKDKKFFLESNLFNNIYSGDLDEDVFKSEETNENIFDANSYSIKDLDNTVKKLKDALIDSLDKESMTKTQETIDVNDEKVDTNKVTYKLDKESTKKLFSSIAQIILDDEDLLNNLSKISGTSKEDLTKALEEVQKDEFYDDFTDEDNMEIAIYTAGLTYKFVKFEIVEKDGKIEYINYKETNKFIFNDIENNELYEVNFKIRNDVITITVTCNKEQIVKYVIKELTDDKLNIEFEINDGETKLDGGIIMELKTNTDTEASGTMTLTLDINSNTGKYDLKADVDFKVLVGTKVEDRKFDNAIDIKNFKDEDAKKAEEVLTNMENSNLYKYFIGLFAFNPSGLLTTPTI